MDFGGRWASFILAAPIAWWIAPRLRARYWRGRATANRSPLSAPKAWPALSKGAPDLAGSNLAKHEQDHQNNERKAERAAPVVAGAVKGAAPPIPLKPPNNAMTKMMRMIVPTDILEFPLSSISRNRRLAHDFGRRVKLAYDTADNHYFEYSNVGGI